MASIDYTHVMALAIILFIIGLFGVLVRRNFLLVVVGIELMLNAAGLAFLAGALRHGNIDGHVMVVLILAVAAAETSVALSLILQFYRVRGSLDVHAASLLRQ